MLLHWAQTNIHSLVTKYQQKSPKGKWDIFRKIINAWLAVCGLSILDRNFKPYWLSYLTSMTFVDFFALTFYTMWKLRSEPVRALSATCLSGVAIPVNHSLVLFRDIHH